MATLSELARQRKDGLKRLQKASLTLDAQQEKVEREVKRLLNRKKAIPESADMTRIITLLVGVSTALDSMAAIANDNLAMYGR